MNKICALVLLVLLGPALPAIVAAGSAPAAAEPPAPAVKSAKKAAIAFADHVGRSTTFETDPLPAALDELDAARSKLRATAKLPTSEHSGKPLPAAQLVPLLDGKDPMTSLVVDTIRPHTAWSCSARPIAGSSSSR